MFCIFILWKFESRAVWILRVWLWGFVFNIVIALEYLFEVFLGDGGNCSGVCRGICGVLMFG